LPLGLVAGYGRRRHRYVLAGGALVLASLVAVALARSLGPLIAAFVAFFPASGAFVSLTEAALMDRDPSRRQQRMAAWNLAGSAGAVAGPLLLAAVLAMGGTWRVGYLALAGAAGAALAGAAIGGPAKATPGRNGSRPDAPHDGDHDSDHDCEPDCEPDSDHDRAEADEADAGSEERVSAGEALRALRTGQVARWLVLLQVSDLLLDVLTGFVGIYLVYVVHASPAQAAIGVAIRLGAGLAGDAVFVFLAGRISARTVLRASALAAGLLFPAFLVVGPLPAKLAILAALSVATSGWYPVLQASLYAQLPGRSGIAVFWSSVAGLVGALGPLAVGFAAQRFGLAPALACLAVTPVVIFFLS
jgi:FSR family fosmidomycin resistance protein-like MFS transporter